MTEPTSPSSGSRSTCSSRTRTKMFCGCELSFGEEPNTRTCPVCLGHPGTLPVTNAEAVHFGLMIGLALGCEIAPRSIFHRKNYFYPDLPEGLPDLPVRHPALHATGGSATCASTACTSRRTPPSSCTPAARAASTAPRPSVVDFNRGGTPLVEIVTEPDLRSAAEAAELARLLRATLRRHGRVRREHGGGLAARGRQRVDPPGGRGHARHQDRAEEHELVPLPRARDRGRDRAPGARSCARAATVEQETLHFDPADRRRSRSLRSKEEAHDYRYFPEPDLVPLAPTEEMLERARAALPELPAARAERLRARARAARGHRAGCSPSAPSWATSSRRRWRPTAARRRAGSPTGSPASWSRALGDARPGRLEARARGARAARGDGRRTSRSSASRRPRRCSTCWSPRAATRRRSSRRRASAWPARTSWARSSTARSAENADAVEKIRAGNDKAIGAIVGAVMRETKGRADGGEVQRLIRERIGCLSAACAGRTSASRRSRSGGRTCRD